MFSRKLSGTLQDHKAVQCLIFSIKSGAQDFIDRDSVLWVYY